MKITRFFNSLLPLFVLSWMVSCNNHPDTLFMLKDSDETGIHFVRTKVGLLVRAGVENGEMVEALGYHIRRLFVAVFVAGSALAGLGGVMWGLYQETITAHMGSEVMILVFIVVIIGGLGSVGGCFIGAMLVGLLANYTAFLAPKVALVSNIALMVAILMWRPQGLYPVVKAK
jgi:branched-chain amino acid transport system permease protein